MAGYNYLKLLGRIKEKDMTQEQLAKAVGMHESNLSQKLNNRFTFRQGEIVKICEVLEIPSKEIGLYFFTH